MSDKYLLIQNPGVASVEAFTLLGASNKAGSDAIGQFGSGTKFGILSLLRLGCKPIVYCGLTKLEFGTKPIKFEGQDQERVFIKISGQSPEGKQTNRTEDLSLVLRYGEIDWKDPHLALREFVSNSLDAVDGDADKVKVELVDKLRATAGTTKVFVPCTEKVADACYNFSRGLHTWFLHFGRTPDQWKKTCIIKKHTPSPALIYRRGVLVRAVKNAPESLFDYNLNELTLDEARVANDYTVRYEATKVLRACRDKEVALKYLENTTQKVWEASFEIFDTYGDSWLSDASKKESEDFWADVQNSFIDERTVLCSPDQDTSLAEGKGYKIKRISAEFYALAQARKLRTVFSILTADERNGRLVDSVCDPLAQQVVDEVWLDLVKLDRTRGETKPEVRSYTEEISGGARSLGLWNGGVVYINKCLLGAGVSKELYAVALEECAHHITKATDNSRDFQEFFIQTCVKLLRG